MFFKPELRASVQNISSPHSPELAATSIKPGSSERNRHFALGARVGFFVLGCAAAWRAFLRSVFLQRGHPDRCGRPLGLRCSTPTRRHRRDAQRELTAGEPHGAIRDARQALGLDAISITFSAESMWWMFGIGGVSTAASRSLRGRARGIGRETSETLAAAGARVVLADLDKEVAEGAAAEIRARGLHRLRSSPTSPTRPA